MRPCVDALFLVLCLLLLTCLWRFCRIAEAQFERNLEAALTGETWSRVATMVDLTASESGDVGRMKDVLIQLKAHGLPAASR